MTGTVEAFELRVKPPLPFSDASRDAAPDVAPPPAPSKEPQRKGQGIGETVVAFDLKALMASKPGRSPAQPATIPLTMEQHASLCAELALYTGREPEILARYGVTAEDRATLDRHYASIVSESPEQRARWYNAYRDYYQYLVTAARSR
ncbi:MAG: hypothetical protein R3B70_10480 [Polyangiaceae bacterium]